MRQQKLLDALTAIWPRGIAPYDYEAVAMLFELVSAIGPRPAEPEPEKKKRRRVKTGEPEKVVNLLHSTGKASLADVVAALKLKRNRASGILYALHKQGRVKREGQRGAYVWRAP